MRRATSMRGLRLQLLLAAAMNIIAALVSLYLFKDVVSWAAADRFVFGRAVGHVLPVIQFLAFGYLIDRMWRLFMFRSLVVGLGRKAPPNLGVQIGSFFIYAALLFTIINLVFNQPISGFLAVSGIAGLVIGFALRGLVSDLFSGIALNLDHNIEIGDWFDFNHRGRDFSGHLVDIHWRCTVFADRMGNLVLIPNAEFAMATAVNRSRRGVASEYATKLVIGSEHDPGRVLPILERALAYAMLEGAVPQAPAPRAEIGSYEQGQIGYRLRYAVALDKVEPDHATSVVLRAAITFLKAAGIYLYPIYPGYANPNRPDVDWPYSQAVRLRILTSVHLFRVLSAAQLEMLAEAAEPLHARAGITVIRKDEIDDSMMVLADGRLEVIVERADGTTAVNTLWPGDCVGEMSLLTGQPRSATVVARDHSWLIVIRKPILAKLFDANPELTRAIAGLVEERRDANREAAVETVPALTAQPRQSPLLGQILRFFRVTLDAVRDGGDQPTLGL